MRRRSRGIILLVLAVWMCGLTYLVLYHPERLVGEPAVAKAEEPKQVEPAPEAPVPASSETSIAISTVDIEWGKTVGEIRESIQGSRPYATELLPDGYIEYDQLDKYSDQILMVDLKKGKPLLTYKLHRNQERLIEERTESGTRAMSVRVDEVVGVSGYIKPYSRVDVLVTLSRRRSPTTRTVLRNVLVLAAGPKVERVPAETSDETPLDQVKTGKKGEKAEPINVSVVTLQVTPEQAEKLTLAANQGKLRLALRNPLDKVEGKSRGVNLNSLLSRPSNLRRVRVIKGSKVETQYVR